MDTLTKEEIMQESRELIDRLLGAKLYLEMLHGKHPRLYQYYCEQVKKERESRRLSEDAEKQKEENFNRLVGIKPKARNSIL